MRIIYGSSPWNFKCLTGSEGVMVRSEIIPPLQLVKYIYLNIFQVKNDPAHKEESSAAKLGQTIALASFKLAVHPVRSSELLT